VLHDGKIAGGDFIVSDYTGLPTRADRVKWLGTSMNHQMSTPTRSAGSRPAVLGMSESESAPCFFTGRPTPSDRAQCKERISCGLEPNHRVWCFTTILHCCRIVVQGRASAVHDRLRNHAVMPL